MTGMSLFCWRPWMKVTNEPFWNCSIFFHGCKESRQKISFADDMPACLLQLPLFLLFDSKSDHWRPFGWLESRHNRVFNPNIVNPRYLANLRTLLALLGREKDIGHEQSSKHHTTDVYSNHFQIAPMMPSMSWPCSKNPSLVENVSSPITSNCAVPNC
jgi:hypothetical protein